jgi:hypothetical protein
MSNSIPSEIIPAIFFGARFTTNRACLPSISLGLALSRFIPAGTVRLWSPKLTSSATNFSDFGTSTREFLACHVREASPRIVTQITIS